MTTPNCVRRLAALALLVVLTACGPGASQGPAAPDDLRAVTLMLNWHTNTHHGGIYAAQANGWYEDVGIDLRIVEPAEIGADQVVGTGRAEFGISQAESLLPARAAGVPVVSIAALLPQNDSSLMVWVGNDQDPSEITPGDLDDRTYGGFGGALETELITRLVECDGGDPDGVEFVEVGDVDYLSGMAQGRYDFVWVFQGWDVVRAQIEDGTVASLPFADHFDCIPNWYTPIIITSEELLEGDPQLVSDFLAATARGYEVADTDPHATAQALMQAAPELDERLVTESAEYYAGRFADPWGMQDAEVWSRFADFILEAGLVDQEVDPEAAFTNEHLPQP